MTIERKLLSTSPSDDAANVDEVFSTHLYTGTGSNRTINNGIDLSGEGGLVWLKCRSTGTWHKISDTERGANKLLHSNETDAESTVANTTTSFNSNGFSLGAGGTGNANDVNTSGRTYASWTFRKKKKFFDIVTYTGNGVAGRTVAHNLGSVPGMMIVRNLANGYSWQVYHRSMANTDRIELDNTGAKSTGATTYWNSTTPTSSVFTLGTQNQVNEDGDSFVAYLFADNSSEDAEEQMIKCGTYEGTGASVGATVNLGWEPQFVLVKSIDSSSNWVMLDTMRGIGRNVDNRTLYAHYSAAEAENANWLELNSTGFKIFNGNYGDGNTNQKTYIYMAIRAPMMKEPEAATEVFALLKEDSGNLNQTPPFKQVSNFPVDFVINKRYTTSSPWWSGIRLTESRVQLDLSADGETAVNNTHEFDHNDGVGVKGLTGGSNFMSYMFKRAKGFFDIVGYYGNSTSGRTEAHSLGVVPEMMWVRRTNGSGEWKVYHSTAGATKYMVLNSTDALQTVAGLWNNTAPSATTFTLGNDSGVNGYNNSYVAFLFATLAGVSKVGSYTGNGSYQTINCGFSAGARFILVKSTQATHNWILIDSVRGIVSGNDPYMQVDNESASVANIDIVDPHNSGFIVNNHGEVNTSGHVYIFYAIA